MAKKAADPVSGFDQALRAQVLESLEFLVERLPPGDVAFLLETIRNYDMLFSRDDLGIINAFHFTVRVQPPVIQCRSVEEYEQLNLALHEMRTAPKSKRLKPVGSGWHLWINPKTQGGEGANA